MIYIKKEVSPNELASIMFPNVEKGIEIHFGPEIQTIPSSYSCEIQCLNLAHVIDLHPESKYCYFMLESSRIWINKSVNDQSNDIVIVKYKTFINKVKGDE